MSIHKNIHSPRLQHIGECASKWVIHCGIFAIILCLSIAALSVRADIDVKDPDALLGPAIKEIAGGGGKTLTPGEIIGQLIIVVLGFLGVVFVIMVIYGGFMYMGAGGDSKKTKEARQFIINASIGVGIVLFSGAITWFIMGKLISTQ